MDEKDLLSSLLSNPNQLQSAIAAASALVGPAPPATPQEAADPSAALLQRLSPLLRQASGGQNTVSKEKRDLLNAIKPFVSTEIAGQIDHGIRLATLARTAAVLLAQRIEPEQTKEDAHV